MVSSLKGFVISFWPSEQEIQDSACENGYLAGLTEFYNSLDELRNALVVQYVGHQVYTYVSRHEGTRRIGAFPPEVAEFLFTLFEVLAEGAILYKLIRLWVEFKNGRKIRVKVDNIEVEATQLSEKQFMNLLTTIEKHRKKMDSASKMAGGYRKSERTWNSLVDALATRLESEGFTLRDLRKLSERDIRRDEEIKLKHLFRESKVRCRGTVSRSRKKKMSRGT